MHLASRVVRTSEIAAAFGVRVALFMAPLVVVSACQAVLGDFEVTPEFESTALGVACLPNTFRCDGRDLLVCDDRRTGFELYMSCDSEDECDPTAGACRPCMPDEWACNGKTLARCSVDSRWEPMTDCDNPELCVISDQRDSGGCASPVCTPAGSFACEGTHLLRCSDAQHELTQVEDCKDVALCDAAAAAADTGPPHCSAAPCGDACPPPTCDEPGAVRCAPTGIPAIQVCGTDLAWTIREVCGHRALCSAEHGRCLPPACAPSERRCLGQVRQECAADRTRFEDLETCAAGTVCEPDGCTPTPCTDGTARCNGVSFEQCIGGAFRPADRCATAVLCNPATGCDDPVCGGVLPEKQFVCDDESTLRRCRPGRDNYDTFTCGTGEVCDAVTGLCQMPYQMP